MKRQLRSYLLGASTTGLANVLGSAVATALVLPVFIRAAGLEGYAVWATLPLFVGIASLADLGASKALVFLLPRAGSVREAREVFSVGVGLAATMGAAIAGGLWLLHAAGVPLLGEGGGFSAEEIRHVLGAGTVVLLSSMGMAPLRAALEARLHVSLVNLGYLLQTVGSYGAGLAGYLLTGAPLAALHASAAAYVALLALHGAAVALRTDLRPVLPERARTRSVVRHSLRYFRVAVPNASLLPLARYLFLAVSPAAAAYGLFDVFTRIGSLALGALQSFSTPLFALFSSLAARGAHGRSDLLARRFAVFLAFLYASGVLVFLAVGPIILHYLVGRAATTVEWWSAVAVLIGVALFGVAEPFVRLLLARGSTSLAFAIQSLQPVTGLTLVLALGHLPPLPRFSLAYGAAYGVSAMAYLFWTTRQHAVVPAEAA